MKCVYCSVEVEEGDNFCSNCGKRLPTSTEEEFIGKFFKEGYGYDEILHHLSSNNIVISLRTLKRRLKNLGLTRNDRAVSQDFLRNTIENEILGPASQMGYRSMWHLLGCSRGIFVSRDRVMEMAKIVDPRAVVQRRTRRLKRRLYCSSGPNDCWHLDGYDKLKPFGAFPYMAALMVIVGN